MKKWQMWVWTPRPKVITWEKIPKEKEKITLVKLSNLLKIKYPLTGYFEPNIYLFKDDSGEHYKNINYSNKRHSESLLVNTKNYPKNEFYIRVLEQLAYGFGNYGAGEIARGKFIYKEVKKEKEKIIKYPLISFRLNNFDYGNLKITARSSNKTLSRLCKELVLNKVKKIKIVEHNKIYENDLKNLKKYINELKKIGVNLNQLTRGLNTFNLLVEYENETGQIINKEELNIEKELKLTLKNLNLIIKNLSTKIVN